MNSLKCMYCGSLTEGHNIVAKKKIDGKVVTVSDTPVHYCRKCDETFLSTEAIKVFNYIRDMKLSHSRILFNFSDIEVKLKKYTDGDKG